MLFTVDIARNLMAIISTSSANRTVAGHPLCSPRDAWSYPDVYPLLITDKYALLCNSFINFTKIPRSHIFSKLNT